MQDKTREILLEAFYKVKKQSGIALERVDFKLVGGNAVSGEVDYHCARIEVRGQSVTSKEDGEASGGRTESQETVRGGGYISPLPPAPETPGFVETARKLFGKEGE